MVTAVLDDRPDTVWAVLRDLREVPIWLDASAAPDSPEGGRPAWPLVGAHLDYQVGRGRRHRVVTLDVLECEPGKRLVLALTRPVLGSVRLGRAIAGVTVVDIGLQPAPVSRTVVTVASNPLGAVRFVPAATGPVSDRAARRIVTNLIGQLRLRGPVMTTPAEWTDTVSMPHR